MELKQKLNKQIKLQAWSLGMVLLCIVGIGSMFIGFASGFNGFYIAGVIIILAEGIANLVLWILGIVNAVGIHKITNDSTLLIIFSVFTLWVAALIMAITEKNKYKNKNYSVIDNTPVQNNANPNDQFKQKQESLKNALINEVISAAEFEKKMKEIKEQYKKYN